MAKVLMVQTLPHKWKITTVDGKVITDDLYLPKYKAEDYIKAWISSFHCWTYEMVFLPVEEKKDVRRR